MRGLPHASSNERTRMCKQEHVCILVFFVFFLDCMLWTAFLLMCTLTHLRNMEMHSTWRLKLHLRDPRDLTYARPSSQLLRVRMKHAEVDFFSFQSQRRGWEQVLNPDGDVQNSVNNSMLASLTCQKSPIWAPPNQGALAPECAVKDHQGYRGKRSNFT